MIESNKELEAIFARAREIAVKHKHEYLTAEHLLLAMLTDRDFLNLMFKHQVKVEEIVKERYVMLLFKVLIPNVDFQYLSKPPGLFHSSFHNCTIELKGGSYCVHCQWRKLLQ